MKPKKMTKQVREMVESVNQRMREFHIKDEQDPIFNATIWLLLQAHCYRGFNYFTADGNLSGGDNEKFDHLELYAY